LLIAAAAVCYANALRAPFVFDDYGSIADNGHVRQLWPLTVSMSAPPQSALAGRPIAAVTFALTYAVGGLDPAWHRTLNLLIHVAAALLLYGIVRRTLRGIRGNAITNADDWTAFACALLWLVHPLNTEVIDYVTQRTEALFGASVFATLYAARRAMDSRSARTSRGWTTVAIVVCTTGMASKESAVITPVLVLLYDASFVAGSVTAALRARRWLYAGLALTWIVLAALVVPGPRSHSAGFASGVTPWAYAIQQPQMIAHYLLLAFRPIGLVVDYGPAGAGAVRTAAPYLILLIAIAAAAVMLWRRDRRLGFLAVCFFLALAPTSSIVPIATEVGAERRMYVPLAAIVVLAVIAIRRDRVRFALSAVAAVTLAMLTIARNREYRTETALWQTVLARHPHGRAHYQLGIALRAEGDRAAAIDEYRRSLPDCADGHYALGFELATDGRHEEAIAHLRDYIRAAPDAANVLRARELLGRSLLRTGRAVDAEDAVRTLLQMQPRNAAAHALVADALLAQERYADAEREYRTSLSLGADEAVARQNLGIALVGQHRDADALAEFTRAVELAPADPRAYHSLGNALASSGRLDDAIRAYRRSLELAPGNEAVREALQTVAAARSVEHRSPR
jgi:Flp pilus assembly protein TadD